MWGGGGQLVECRLTHFIPNPTKGATEHPGAHDGAVEGVAFSNPGINGVRAVGVVGFQ